jgi:hypothetical protein
LANMQCGRSAASAASEALFVAKIFLAAYSLVNYAYRSGRDKNFTRGKVADLQEPSDELAAKTTHLKEKLVWFPDAIFELAIHVRTARRIARSTVLDSLTNLELVGHSC